MEYESGKCTLNNTIIKTQFPSKILIFGEDTFKYINFVTMSNGDMIIETSSFPPTNKRIFFGLKSNGRYYFHQKYINEENLFKHLTANKKEENKYESGNSIIIYNGKEYFVSIGRLETYTELYDFDNDKIISKKTKDLIGHENMNMRSNLINIDKKENRFIFSCLSKIDDIMTGLILKFDLELKSNKLELSNKIERKIKYCFGEISSCFKTETNNLIICFYGYSKNWQNASFIILAYDENFNQINEHYFSPPGINLYN
jgi:hypothetical protein